ncbi:MAG: hypothetical protein AAGF67_07525 [Verrucomicrobiota bacterium]
MKLLTTILLAFPFAMIAQDELPSRFDLLTGNYERAVERATKPITQQYVAELKTLLRELIQQGKLAEAQEVEQKLRDLGALEKTLRDILISRTWEYSANGAKSQIVFNEDGTAKIAGASNGTLPWKLEDELSLTIERLPKVRS